MMTIMTNIKFRVAVLGLQNVAERHVIFPVAQSGCEEKPNRFYVYLVNYSFNQRYIYSQKFNGNVESNLVV